MEQQEKLDSEEKTHFLEDAAADFGLTVDTGADAAVNQLYEMFQDNFDAAEVFEDPPYTQAIYCERDGLSVIKMSGRQGKPTCPVCEKPAKYLDSEADMSRFNVCVNPKCSHYNKIAASDTKGLCQENIAVGGSKGKVCGKPVEVLDFDLAEHIGLDAIEAENEADTGKGDKTTRQLKNLIRAAQGFIQGSGTHHRSTGGRHTSGDQQKHSAAHGSKKQVRERYAENIKTLLEGGAEVEPWLRKLAEATIKQVLAK